MNGLDRDDVMGMALEAGLGSGRGVIQITKFAALVAAAEREACAKVCDSVNNYDNPMTASDCADAIRARGQQDNG
jgi:hypothetical protein